VSVNCATERGEAHMVSTFDRWRALNLLDAEIFNSIEKDTWKVLPLQVADLIAFEAMKD
jgi:hypothetical protein